MVCLFNKTIKNILYNFISHETNTCEDKDYTWIDKSIKRLIQDKMRPINVLKVVIPTVSPVKIFNPFRVSLVFPLKL